MGNTARYSSFLIKIVVKNTHCIMVVRYEQILWICINHEALKEHFVSNAKIKAGKWDPNKASNHVYYTNTTCS